jgi:hypothetical protein
MRVSLMRVSLVRWRGSQHGRKHEPGHELEQERAPNHLPTALRPAMTQMVVIPAVVNIQIAKTSTLASRFALISFFPV